MRIIELTIEQFDEYASTHPLRHYLQSSSYAKLMGEKGYNYDYVGFEDNGNILAASLILYKKIGKFYKYAYAPRGFLIDYYNKVLVQSFTKELIKKYKSKKVVFIKINPEIIIAEIDSTNNFLSNYNKNVSIIDDLKSIGFKRRRELMPLDFIEPRISPFISLKEYKHSLLNKDIIDKLDSATKKGLSLEVVTSREIDIFYDFIKDQTKVSINYYRNLVNIFNRENMVDFILIKLNYREFLLEVKKNYEEELEQNNKYNEAIQKNANEKNLNIKMESDKILLQLKNYIVEATEGLKKTQEEYIAGAIIVKYQNRISILENGYNYKFMNLYPEYFLIHNVIKKYKKDYDFLEFNGLASDFSENSQFYEENQFKLDFNPYIYEYIGEFDLIISESRFKKLQNQDLIAKEFNKLK